MLRQDEVWYDAASAMSKGRRSYQEDALITDFPIGSEIGLSVLADGMGGHAAGDVASKIAVTEVFSELKLSSEGLDGADARVPKVLENAVQAANSCIRNHAESNAETEGMGATLLALVLVRNEAFWISVGDSPLFHFSEGALSKVNEDHSMAPQLDLMVTLGQMREDEARFHPERNCLTSVLCGAPIPRIDCPEEAMPLAVGDILVAASDGLQFLSDREVEAVLREHADASSAEIAKALLRAIEVKDDPDQDNVAISVVKLRPAAPAPQIAAAADVTFHTQRRVHLPEAAMAARSSTSLLRSVLSFGWGRFSRKGVQ